MGLGLSLSTRGGERKAMISFFIYHHTRVFDFTTFGTQRDTASDGTLFNVALNTHGTTAILFIGP